MSGEYVLAPNKGHAFCNHLADLTVINKLYENIVQRSYYFTAVEIMLHRGPEDTHLLRRLLT